MLPGLLFVCSSGTASPLEVVIQQMIQCCFIRPKERPYQTNNARRTCAAIQMEQGGKGHCPKTIPAKPKSSKLTRAQKKKLMPLSVSTKGDGKPHGTGHHPV